MDNKIPYKVMLSSTYREMIEHRTAVRDAMLSQRLLPVAMEDDAALPDRDLIKASLAKVDESDAYAGLIGYRYGQRPVCEIRNPLQLSLTELEFRRAVSRGIPICMFIMHDDHPIPKKSMTEEKGSDEKFESFVRLAKTNRIYAEFASIPDLKVKAIQSFVTLREVLDAQSAITKAGQQTQADVRSDKDEAARAAPVFDGTADPPTVGPGRTDKRSSQMLFAIAFLALSAICAWVLSRLVGEPDVSVIVLSLFSLGFAFFAAVGILALRKSTRHGD